MATTSGEFTFGAGTLTWTDTVDSSVTHTPCLKFRWWLTDIKDKSCDFNFIVVGSGHNSGNYTDSDYHTGYSEVNPWTLMGTQLTIRCTSNSSLIKNVGSKNRMGANNGTIIVPESTIQDIPLDNNGSFSLSITGKYDIYYGSWKDVGNINISGNVINVKDPVSPSISLSYNNANTLTVKYTFGAYTGSNNATIYLNCNAAASSGANKFSYTKTGGKDGTQYSISKDIINDIKADVNFNGKIYATIVHGTGNNARSASAVVDVKAYYWPNEPTNLQVRSNKKKNTVKSVYTFSWTAATAGSINSPIIGYRIRVHRIRNEADSLFNIDIDSTPDYIDRDKGWGTEFIFDASKYDLKPGDKIYIGLHSYAQNGAGTYLYSGDKGNRQTKSTPIELVADKNYVAWARATTDSEWKPVEVLYAKHDGSFKEIENIYPINKTDGRSIG